MAFQKAIRRILAERQEELLPAWFDCQVELLEHRADVTTEVDLLEQSREFLRLLAEAVQDQRLDRVEGPGWTAVLELLAELSRGRVHRGFTPRDTARFVFSLKQPLFELLREELSDGKQYGQAIWSVSLMLGQLGLYTTEVFQKSREEIIHRQRQELMELSTPVVKLWDGVLALPLIGTLDSERTQVVMESLLERIVETGARLAIVDITGVPTVDTLVAQHLLKTIAAARLMGADCIISGIRPQIAQTIVHLGVDLSTVLTKATLAAAFRVALERMDLQVAPKGETGAGA